MTDKKSNVYVLCCQCAGHFKKEDVHKMKIEGIKYNFHICNPCLKNVPTLSQHIVPTIKKA